VNRPVPQVIACHDEILKDSGILEGQADLLPTARLEHVPEITLLGARCRQLISDARDAVGALRPNNTTTIFAGLGFSVVDSTRRHVLVEHDAREDPVRRLGLVVRYLVTGAEHAREGQVAKLAHQATDIILIGLQFRVSSLMESFGDLGSDR
jgi:hypothetical protein